MWFIGVEVEQETSAPPLKKFLDPPLGTIFDGTCAFTCIQHCDIISFENLCFHSSKRVHHLYSGENFWPENMGPFSLDGCRPYRKRNHRFQTKKKRTRVDWVLGSFSSF